MLQIRHAHSVVKLEETKKRNEPKHLKTDICLNMSRGVYN